MSSKIRGHLCGHANATATLWQYKATTLNRHDNVVNYRTFAIILNFQMIVISQKGRGEIPMAVPKKCWCTRMIMQAERS
jgi:hypothetical protein